MAHLKQLTKVLKAINRVSSWSKTLQYFEKSSATGDVKNDQWVVWSVDMRKNW